MRIKDRSPLETRLKATLDINIIVNLHFPLKQFISGFEMLGSGRSSHSNRSEAEYSECPFEATTPEMINKIHNLVTDDRRMKVRKIANAVGIPSEWVLNILQPYFDMKKLSAR